MTLNISHGVVSVSEASMSKKSNQVIDKQLPWEQLDAILQQLAGLS